MIFKFQQGGIPPLVSYLPVVVPELLAAVSLKDTSQKTADLTDKDLLSMLDKMDGLPIDTQIVRQKLLNFLIDLKYGMYPDTSSIASRYLLILEEAKIANFNRKEYDSAYETVNKNGGINEFAISDRGLLFCINNEGDFKLLRVEDLNSNPEYKPLTNSELLQYRAFSTNNNEILRIVKNGIGIEAVTKMILDSIGNLGTSLVSTSGYSERELGVIKNGIEVIKDAAKLGLVYGQNADNMSVDGLYKSELITKDQALQAKAALNYVYATLPENAKTLLKLKSDGTDLGVENLLKQLISSKTGSTREFKLDILKNPDGTISSLKNAITGEKINAAVAFLMDMGAEHPLIFAKGTPGSLIVLTYKLPIVDKDGNNLGNKTLDKVANESVYGGILDFSLITVGNLLISSASAKNVVVDGTNIYKAYLPVDLELLSRGVVTPNFDYLQLLEVVLSDLKEIASLKGISVKELSELYPEEVNKVYEGYNLPKFVDENGKVNENFYKPFGLVNVTALSDAFREGTDFSSFEEIKDENEIRSYWTTIKGDSTKEEFDFENWYEGWFGANNYLRLLKGIAFIPMSGIDPTLGAYSGGDTPTLGLLNRNRTLTLLEERIRSFQPQGQLLL